MEVNFRCPRCGGPLALSVHVDTKTELINQDEFGAFSRLEKYSDPVPIQVRQCNRCGYKKHVFLRGLPDDERSYEEWAKDEAELRFQGVSP